MKLNLDHRSQTLSKLSKTTWDLVIIGGGITGAGLARDAASRGMKVLVLEARDFAIGTSSRSSKLIHGGVRYLENFEFHLVFEALSERARLFKLAPHLVHPLRFLIPIYKSSRVGLFKMTLGMWLYDLLALFETPQMHETLNTDEVKERIPDIEARGLVGAVEYSDAYTDDDRLVIETLRDAVRMGASVANYAPVVSCQKDESGRIESLEAIDELTGKRLTIHSDQFVSGVGPWTDILGRTMDPQWKNRLRPTKGVHLVFSRKRIPVQKAIVMAVESRIIFVIPRHEMVIVGTTDTDFKMDPAQVNTEEKDVEYLLAALNQYFPKLQIVREDIVSSYAGVRPLVDDGSSTEGKTSREHSIFGHGPNLTVIAGGKYTTYRKISEEGVDAVLSKMPFEKRMAFGPSKTATPLNPKVTPELYARALKLVPAWAKQFSMDQSLVRKVVFRHGEEGIELLKKIRQSYLSYSANEAMWMAEADFAIENTLCLRLADFYWRRSPLFLASKNHGSVYINAIAKVFADSYGWTAEKTADEKRQLLQQMQVELAWKGDALVAETSQSI